jgi:hypothetical protein
MRKWNERREKEDEESCNSRWFWFFGFVLPAVEVLRWRK